MAASCSGARRCWCDGADESDRAATPASTHMKDGARILVRTCADVLAGENAVVVTDPERMAIARAVADEALEAGAVASIVMPPARSIDNEEPGPAVAAALSAADVVFLPVTLAMAHTRAVREAIEAGARVLSMTAFTGRMMREGGLFTDFRARQPLCRAIAARLTAGNRLRMTNPAGTDLTLSLEGVTGNSHACLLDGPGFSAVPNIEANCAPTQGTAEGVFVCDGSIPYYASARARPVTFRSRKASSHTSRAATGTFWRRCWPQEDLGHLPVRVRPEPGLHGFTGDLLTRGVTHVLSVARPPTGGSVSARRISLPWRGPRGLDRWGSGGGWGEIVSTGSYGRQHPGLPAPDRSRPNHL